MAVRESNLTYDRSRLRGNYLSPRFVELSHLRRLCECEQIASICYRLGRNGIEFLLVQTRGSRRWTFPKGGVEPGLTHAEAAALEAFEEAGVHGRMEEAPFAQYVGRRRSGKKNSSTRKEAISAHLCEVLWHGPPEESRRNPRWFSPENAKRRLRENRSSKFGGELARVTDLAVARIQRLHSKICAAVDGLQRVRFEAVEMNGFPEQVASFSRHVRRAGGDLQSSEIQLAVHAHLSKVLQFVPPQGLQQNRVLTAGDPAQLVGAANGFMTRVPQLPSAAGNCDSTTAKSKNHPTKALN
jgi:8-oxo-dGTP pyrophosphatase MutT (NUDIX family)